jgi:hypothetical protein
VPECTLIRVVTATSYKSTGTDQFLAELIKAGGETLSSEMN